MDFMRQKLTDWDLEYHFEEPPVREAEDEPVRRSRRRGTGTAAAPAVRSRQRSVFSFLPPHGPEPVSPLSDETKPRYLSGTSGATLTEEQLNLQVGLKLRDALTELGAEVVMTREVSEISLPNPPQDWS